VGYDEVMSPAATETGKLALDYTHTKIGKATILHADCLEWLGRVPPGSIHGIVTDPPYGVKEYEFDQIEKRANGNGGIWRIPPSFDGANRQPLPRFTALNERERRQLCRFFAEWAKAAAHALLPGGHVILACNSFLAQLVYGALVGGGLEFRGQIIRIVRTLRGGDRPKNAEEEFPGVCSLPRGAYEPWGIFRKPLPPGMTVGECLRKFGTGGLRRLPEGLPFSDVLDIGRTPKVEREIAPHPSLKPQALLRELVWAILPLGEGLVCDPFMGSGSTIAAAEAIGYRSVGVEKYDSYYRIASEAIRPLSHIPVERDQLGLGFDH
jgi:site-specific DNA-methyltransferase (adenine-specific)